jgi:hypothetical protein
MRWNDRHGRHSRAVAAVAAAAALGVAGCGGGEGPLSKAAYEQKLHRAGDELSAAVRRLAKARSEAEFRDNVVAVQRALDDASGELDAITPPKDVEGANDRLVHGLRGLEQDFEKLEAAAGRGVDEATRMAREISTGAAAREAQQAIMEIKRRGYDVGALGRQ